ncbi:MAG TPA: MFS transporter [Acetobacteraceae bacterium]|nr:MFS transporter [Acetobacteraceae bacterium]
MPGRADRQRWATLALFLGNGIAIGTWAGAIPRLQHALALSPARLSLALLAFAAGAVIAMPLAGRLASRVGAGRLAIAAAFLLAVALMLPAMAPDLPLLVAAAVAMGIANGSMDVAMNARASEVERRRGRPLMSSFHAGFSLGGLAGAAAAGSLAGAGLGLAACLAVGAAVDAGLAGLAAPWIGNERHAPAARGPGRGFAWPSAAMLGLCAAAVLCMMTEGAMMDWSAVYLVRVAGAGAGAAAFGYAAFSMAMAAGRLAGDRVVGAFGAPRVARTGGLLAASGLALAVLVPVPAAGIAGFALVGCGLANVVPTVFSAAARLGVTPARGVATVATIGYAGFLAGPPLIGGIATFAGLRAGLGLLAAAAATIGAMARGLATSPGRRRAPARAPAGQT